MESKFTSAYTYFDDLAKSSEFLGFLINNISTGVFILNKNLELQAFNEPFKNMFSNKPDEHLLYAQCGEAIGCAYQVEEKKKCGKTTRCKTCELRIDALDAYTRRKAIFKKSIVREFYNVNGSKENKTLTYTIKPFHYKRDYYLMVLTEINKTWLKKNIETHVLPSESFYS